MGFMDKFKNLFTDEEIIEEEVNEPIEIKEVKKEEEVHKLPTFMRERLGIDEDKNESKKDFKLNDFDEFEDDFQVKREKKIEPFSIESDSKRDEKFSKNLDDRSSFKFPLEFNDDDFIETRSRHKMHSQREEVVITPKELKTKEVKEPIKQPKKETTKVSELYKEKKQDVKKFKATPIISPIYGVLNKNYNSEEVECFKGDNLEGKRHSKSVDFDTVRKKAYGNISKEIKENLMCENCEYLKEAKECKKHKQKEVEDNIVYEALNDVNDEEYDYYSNITLDEATENYYDHGVEYEKTKIGSRVNRDIINNEIKINNHEVDYERGYSNREVPPVKSSINLLSTIKKSMGEEEEEKNLELTDDLFNLIDSMYDERND